MKNIPALAAALCVAVLLTPVAHAQSLQNLYVGSNSSGVIINLSTSSGTRAFTNIFVGFLGGADSNKLRILNTGTFVTNSRSVYVGNGGSSNSMVISNGGKLISIGTSYVGFSNTANNNSVLVTGTNSLWTNSVGIFVGRQGAGNSLVISNGGTVVADGFGVGVVGSAASSSNNSVLVTGAGSLWTNSSSLNVGDEGSGNSLVISNGGSVAVGSFGYIGDASDNNSVTVSGTNSSLAVTNGFYVGYGGSSNSLSISDGASVTVVGTSDADYFSLGETGTSSGNTLTVSGASTLSVNVATNSLYGIWIAGFDGSSHNAMVVSSGGKVYSGGQSAIGVFTDALNNSALVTGTGSLWTNNGLIMVGGGSGGQGILTVADGGTLASTSITLAADADSSGTLNIGSFGGSDTAGTINAPTIAFGDGTGAINFNQSDSTTLSAAISGNGSVNQLGSGTTTLTASNSFSGPISVEAGTLQLASATGSAAGSVTSVSVRSGATLLVSQSNQVNNNATVTLSGGTITRGSGVSEVFGNLNLTEASFLDFGTGTAGNLTFGTYTPSSLLTINNFGLGNTLVFGSDLTSTINNSSFFTFTNGGIASSSWNEGTSTFTITAIPEPSTYVAAIALLALMLWPLRRRLRVK